MSLESLSSEEGLIPQRTAKCRRELAGSNNYTEIQNTPITASRKGKKSVGGGGEQMDDTNCLILMLKSGRYSDLSRG